MEKFIFGRTFPLIIEIPDRTGPMEGRVSIRQMVRSAVGINV
jgi:vacuolar-type H+-ATPase subunit F/Vma7